MRNLLNLGFRLEILARDEIRDIVVIVIVLLVLITLLLLHALEILGELAQRRQRVGAELVEDAGNELGQLLVLTVAVDSEGIGGYGGVNCSRKSVCGKPMHSIRDYAIDSRIELLV